VLPVSLTMTHGSTTAEFKPAPQIVPAIDTLLTRFKQTQLTFRIVLKCDFLKAEKHMVDGDFLGGRLPTGDGVQGGDFESWFTVERDPNSTTFTSVTGVDHVLR
jgi:hypothetical protein